MKATYLAHMGDDLMVVNAARVSFNKKHEEFELFNDRKLINFLARNNHWTPFAHPQAQFHMKAPIFLARQLFKHKIGFVENEVSRRYVDTEPEVYYPKEWRGRADNKKQGSSDEVIDIAVRGHDSGGEWEFDPYNIIVEDSIDTYKELIEKGVAPEMARMVLPLSTYTEWIWTGSLAAWARVYNLRLGEDAQKEHEILMKDIGDKMYELFPASWEALVNYVEE